MDIKNLDGVVLQALSLFSSQRPPSVDFSGFRKPLVTGSVGAFGTARMLFSDRDAIFADESSLEQALNSHNDIDGAFLISASGGKHAPGIAKILQKRKIPCILLTCNPQAQASSLVSRTYVFPKQAEPYSYNTSTYLGMILSKTRENPKKILEHIRKLKIPQDLASYDAFFLMVPENFGLIREMLLIKFDELFGPRVSGRAFTFEQAKHAKTIVQSEKELFISFGEKDKLFGSKRLHIPLPRNAGYAAMMAVGYYVAGKIQSQHPPYFKEGIEEYCRRASKIFGEKIEPIVG